MERIFSVGLRRRESSSYLHMLDTRTHARTCTHAHTHAHTHKHTHTHTHTHLSHLIRTTPQCPANSLQSLQGNFHHPIPLRPTVHYTANAVPQGLCIGLQGTATIHRSTCSLHRVEGMDTGADGLHGGTPPFTWGKHNLHGIHTVYMGYQCGTQGWMEYIGAQHPFHWT